MPQMHSISYQSAFETREDAHLADLQIECSLVGTGARAIGKRTKIGSLRQLITEGKKNPRKIVPENSREKGIFKRHTQKKHPREEKTTAPSKSR